MDLQQRKLNKSEWQNIEIPVSKQEQHILRMIKDGYENVNIKVNNNNSIFTFLKIEYSEAKEDYLYNKYFKHLVDEIEQMLVKEDPAYKGLKLATTIKISSADKIRLENNEEKTIKTANLYEFILLEHANKCISYKIDKNNKLFTFYYFNLYKLMKNMWIK